LREPRRIEILDREKDSTFLVKGRQVSTIIV
jgi:hypothetical protein